MILAIMQPYFFPYIGYFQLIRAVDAFVVYDNIKYTKKGWINRNRYLRQGCAAAFTIPLQKASDHLNIDQRRLAPDFDRCRPLNRIREAYRAAPCFHDVFPLFERALLYPDLNLFGFIYHSLAEACRFMNLQTPMIASSSLDIDPSLKGQSKVIATCKRLGATIYINPSGGMELYSAQEFRSSGIDLRFLNSIMVPYKQFDHAFVPRLSILDVMMFNGSAALQDLLQKYEIIEQDASPCFDGTN